jgi:hypothetical protein
MAPGWFRYPVTVAGQLHQSLIASDPERRTQRFRKAVIDELTDLAYLERDDLAAPWDELRWPIEEMFEGFSAIPDAFSIGRSTVDGFIEVVRLKSSLPTP